MALTQAQIESRVDAEGRRPWWSFLRRHPLLVIGGVLLVKAIVERIERVNEEIKGLSDDRSDIFSEAKGNGFDTKVMRKIIALRKVSSKDPAAQDQILETYMHALGMV